MNKKLKFKLLKQNEKGRAWDIELNWTTLKTPVFMPVWTKATIKWIPLEFLQDSDFLWSENFMNIILANTFHLYLNPWDQIIKNAWWLHRFENRNKLILTDSGWFQVFSLWLGNKKDKLIKVENNWVHFKSPKDWSKHFFTPEKVIDIQSNFRSDIMMMLDVCSPVTDITKEEVNEQMQTTHRWAEIAYRYHMEKYEKTRWALFPIIQWWLYKDLREESIKHISKFATDGIAVGWLSVWETKDKFDEMIDFIWDKLPSDIPRYLMWIWTPDYIRQAIKSWIDMFDCVLPTRLGRHGWAFYQDQTIKLKNACFREDFSPVDKNCNCYCCRNFSRAYIHHLLKEKEMLWWILLSFHNIVYLNNLVNKIREEILSD